jgi:hypothetical protein
VPATSRDGRRERTTEQETAERQQCSNRFVDGTLARHAVGRMLSPSTHLRSQKRGLRHRLETLTPKPMLLGAEPDNLTSPRLTAQPFKSASRAPTSRHLSNSKPCVFGLGAICSTLPRSFPPPLRLLEGDNPCSGHNTPAPSFLREWTAFVIGRW